MSVAGRIPIRIQLSCQEKKFIKRGQCISLTRYALSDPRSRSAERGILSAETNTESFPFEFSLSPLAH